MKEHMREFEKLNRKDSCDSDEMEELNGVKTENAADIDKDMYSGLKKWV